MTYKERLSLILIREDGRRRSWRLRVGWLYLAGLGLALFPCLLAGSGWLCYSLWQKAELAQADVLRLENECETMEVKIERLENLSVLLDESAVPGREILERALAESFQPPAEEEADPEQPATDERTATTKEEIQEQMTQNDGPGHAEFPAIKKDYVNVENIRVRVIKPRVLRLSLDLRNTRRNIAEGEVTARLATSDGKETPLLFSPADVGKFRIMRFKRAVITATLPRESPLRTSGAQVVIEVKDNDGSVVFRNIFPIER